MQVNLTANGATNPMHWNGGRGNVAAWGTFGGGSVAVQMSPDAGTTWINIDDLHDTALAFTANGTGEFELGVCMVRFNLTGATAPNVWVSL